MIWGRVLENALYVGRFTCQGQAEVETLGLLVSQAHSCLIAGGHLESK